MKNLLLVEHEWQVRDFLNRGIKGQWIAVGPSAAYALRKWQRPYDVPEAYHTQEELERFCLRCRDSLSPLYEKLDQYMLDQFPRLREWKIRPFTFSRFALTIVMDDLAGRIFKIRKLAEAHPGYALWAYDCPPLPLGILGLELLFSNAETLWGKLLALPGWDFTPKVIPAPHQKLAHLSKSSLGDRFENILGPRLFSAGLAVCNRFQFWREAAAVKRSSSTGETMRQAPGALLVNASAGQWARCFDRLRQQGWILVQGKTRLFKGGARRERESEKRRAFHHFLREAAGGQDGFRFLGVSVLPIVQRHLAWIFDNAQPISKNVHSRLAAMIRAYHLKAILTSSHPTFTSHAVNQIGRHLGLPVLKWQHGAVMTYDDGSVSQMNDLNDLLTSDVVLTFGKEAERSYRRSPVNATAEVVTVGSCSLDAIRTSHRQAQPTKRGTSVQILYVLTNYYENNWYCGFSPPFSTLNYFHDQLVIADYLARQAEAHKAQATIKLCPCPGFLDPPWIEKYAGRSGFRIVWNAPTFVELLSACDLVIIDSPTTTALEAVATRKPVFLLMSHVGYSSRARSLMARRAVCANDVATLTRRLDEYLTTRAYPADLQDNAYLKAYGNYLDDGKSRDRAIAVLEDCLRKRRHHADNLADIHYSHDHRAFGPMTHEELKSRVLS